MFLHLLIYQVAITSAHLVLYRVTSIAITSNRMDFVHFLPNGTALVPFTSDSTAVVHNTFTKITIQTAKCDFCNLNKRTKLYRCVTCSIHICLDCRQNRGDATHSMHAGDRGYEGEPAQLLVTDSGSIRPPTNEPLLRIRQKRNRRVVEEDDSEMDDTASYEPLRKRTKGTHTREPSEEYQEAARVEPSRKRKNWTHTRELSEEYEEAVPAEPARKRRKATHTREINEEVRDAAHDESSGKRKSGTHTKESSQEYKEAARAEPARNRRTAIHTREYGQNDEKGARAESSRTSKSGPHIREPSDEDDQAARAELARKAIGAVHRGNRNAVSTEVNKTTTEGRSHPQVRIVTYRRLLKCLTTQQEVSFDVDQAADLLIRAAGNLTPTSDHSMRLAPPAANSWRNKFSPASSRVSSDGDSISLLLAAADELEAADELSAAATIDTTDDAVPAHELNQPRRSPIAWCVAASGSTAEGDDDRDAQKDETIFMSEAELDLEVQTLRNKSAGHEETTTCESEQEKITEGGDDRDAQEDETIFISEGELDLEVQTLGNKNSGHGETTTCEPEQEEIAGVAEQQDSVSGEPEQEGITSEAGKPLVEGKAEQEEIGSEEDAPAEMVLMVEHVSGRRPVASRLRVLYRESLLVRAPNGKMVKPFSSGRTI